MRHAEGEKSLPVPTAEQTARFADHVADNHSWYKHLPFFPPGASFVFFPNRHAGRGVKVEGERFVVSDTEQGDYFVHHSRLPTADYLARFGHWDYWVDDNPRVHDPQPGPWLYSADGRHRELLADDLKRQWSCRLTAFLRPSPAMFGLRASELQQEADAFLASGRRGLLGLFGRRAEDPVAARYRAVAPALRRAAGTWNVLYPFMESEARAQRELVLGTLHRVRAAWAGAEAGFVAGRCISGNPFGRAALHPSWRTDTVVVLACQMDESGEFSAMPILADALQDAGCDSEDVLSHCRDTNQAHCRGCWVLDLILGKS